LFAAPSSFTPNNIPTAAGGAINLFGTGTNKEAEDASHLAPSVNANGHAVFGLPPVNDGGFDDLSDL